MVDYELLEMQLKALCEDVTYTTSNLANASALIYSTLDRLNWAGFYLTVDGELLLGPFQGKTACTRIQFGKGVCGTAAATRETQLVPNVHEFPGHIACDSASNSEIVVPIIINDEVYGVLDIDSPEFDRFSKEDQTGLERFVKALEDIIVKGK